MRIAVPVWRDMISPVLDTAVTMRIYTVENGVPVMQGEEPFDTVHDTRADSIAKAADTLICGALSQTLEQELKDRHVTIHSWVMGNCDCVVSCFAKGHIGNGDFSMPGCRKNRRGMCRERHGRGRDDFTSN